MFSAYSLMAGAAVDLKNGNYVERWADLQAGSTQAPLEVTRYYNSRSTYRGLFGQGWCSNLETRLDVLPEGRIRIVECGAAAETLYAPASFNLGQLESVVGTIVEQERQSKRPTDLTTLRAQLLRHADQRLAWARHFHLRFPEVPEGVAFSAEQLQVETIRFDGQHYIHTQIDGTQQHFDHSGRLVWMADRGQNWVRLNYEGERLTEVVNRDEQKLTLHYAPGTHQVNLVVGPERRLVRYAYRDGQLSNVTNAWGNTYRHAYNPRGQLIRTDFPDGTFEAIDYHPKHDGVTRYTHRAVGDFSCSESYTYDLAPGQATAPRFLATARKACSGGPVEETRFSFSYLSREDGRLALQRVTRQPTQVLQPEKRDGEDPMAEPLALRCREYDIIYHPIFGKPSQITRADGEPIHFRYRADGLLHDKTQARQRVQFRYDERTHLVSQMVKEFLDDAGQVDSRKEVRFGYSAQGQLMHADNMDGLSLSLKYDPHGQISEITKKHGKKLRIKYDSEHGKPEKVTLVGGGSLIVRYGADGEIASTAGEGKTDPIAIAITLSAMVDSLLEMTTSLSEETQY